MHIIPTPQWEGQFEMSSVKKDGSIDSETVVAGLAKHVFGEVMKTGLHEEEERILLVQGRDPVFEARLKYSWWGKSRLEIVRHPPMKAYWEEYDKLNSPKKEVKKPKMGFIEWVKRTLATLLDLGGLLALNLGGLWFTLIYLGFWAMIKSLWILMFKAVGFFATAWIGMKVVMVVGLLLLTHYCLYYLILLAWNSLVMPQIAGGLAWSLKAQTQQS